REMKLDQESRKRLSAQNTERENTNERVRALLQELFEAGNEHAKSYSPSQQERLKIFEEGVYDNTPENYMGISLDEIDGIRRKNSPSKGEIQKYRLWLEQGYVSPY